MISHYTATISRDFAADLHPGTLGQTHVNLDIRRLSLRVYITETVSEHGSTCHYTHTPVLEMTRSVKVKGTELSHIRH